MLKTTIPFIDLRGKPQTDLLRAYPDTATRLLADSRRTWGIASWAASALLLPFSDWRSHRWLKRNGDPYLHEIEASADILGKRGVYTLNLAYEWGCTSGAYLMGEEVELLRVLDWPFPALGRHVVVALQSAPAGEYYNITWPALSGMYQGMAPGRFAASINQAPMRKHRLGFIGDWFVNRFIANHAKGLPPAHLLRRVFEQAKDYNEAKEMLKSARLAMPVIFTLTGLKRGEACIIERLENKVEVREITGSQHITASNQFHSGFIARKLGWRARELDSPGRYRQSIEISPHDLQQENFGWLKAPMVNIFTRLVMKADAANGTLLVEGYEGQVSVTELYRASR